MRSKIWMLVVMSSFLSSTSAQTGTSTTNDTCPLSFQHIDLRYNHAGGESRPQLELIFTNQSAKKIDSFTFSLSILDAAGYPNSYGDDLVYRTGLEPGKKRVSLWNLQSTSVDMHRTGETAILHKVYFSDGTVWIDAEALECQISVDFHPR